MVSSIRTPTCKVALPGVSVSPGRGREELGSNTLMSVVIVLLTDLSNKLKFRKSCKIYMKISNGHGYDKPLRAFSLISITRWGAIRVLSYFFCGPGGAAWRQKMGRSTKAHGDFGVIPGRLGRMSRGVPLPIRQPTSTI